MPGSMEGRFSCFESLQLFAKKAISVEDIKRGDTYVRDKNFFNERKETVKFKWKLMMRGLRESLEQDHSCIVMSVRIIQKLMQHKVIVGMKNVLCAFRLISIKCASINNVIPFWWKGALSEISQWPFRSPDHAQYRRLTWNTITCLWNWNY